MGVFCLAGHAGAATIGRGTYGPPPPPAGVPGGFSSVLTSVTVGASGGTVGPVTAPGGGDIMLTVPAGAFSSPVQISVTAPDLGAITPSSGDSVVAGVGVQVGRDGANYPGTFSKAITATISSSRISAGSVVLVWNGSAFVADSAATVSAGTATVSFDSDPQFVAETPVATAPSAVPSATEPVTGLPFVGEGVAACGLLVLGSGGLFLAWRRRRNQA